MFVIRSVSIKQRILYRFFAFIKHKKVNKRYLVVYFLVILFPIKLNSQYTSLSFIKKDYLLSILGDLEKMEVSPLDPVIKLQLMTISIVNLFVLFICVNATDYDVMLGNSG